MSESKKPPVSGLNEKPEAPTQRADRNPAGFLNVFQWRWNQKPETKGNIQMSLNISREEVDRAFAGKQPSQNGKTYADIGVILSQAERCTTRKDKDGNLLKVDVTDVFRSMVNAMRDDKDGDLKTEEVASVVHWAITQLKAGHNPKAEMAELNAAAKHAAAMASAVNAAEAKVNADEAKTNTEGKA